MIVATPYNVRNHERRQLRQFSKN